MKNHYVLRLTDLAGHETAHEFICTKSQMDKVFFALAFASCNSTIKRGSLYRVCKAPIKLKIDFCEQLENTFSTRGEHVFKTR